MGCCCSLETSDSLQGETSALLDSPHHDGLSGVTEELRQHAIAVAQHVCLDDEGEGDRGGPCEEETQALPSPDAFCHLNVAYADEEKLDSSNTRRNMDAQTGVGSDPRVELDREENAPDGSEQVWSPPSGLPSADSVLTEASGGRQGPKEARVVTTAPYQGLKTATHSFYSICSIDADDLEQEQSQYPAAGGTADPLHAFTWYEVEEVLKQTSSTPSADLKDESGPVMADPCSDLLIPPSSLWNTEEPSGNSAHADFNEEPPEEPSVRSHAAQGAREGGSEGLHAQQEEDLGQNLAFGFIDDRLDESEPSAVQLTAVGRSSSSVTFTPPLLNQALMSPSETGRPAPQGELAPVGVTEEVRVSLSAMSSRPPPQQPTPTLRSHVETSPEELHKSDNFNDPVKSKGQELDPESESELGAADDADSDLLQLPGEPQPLQEVLHAPSASPHVHDDTPGPSPPCLRPPSSPGTSADEDEAESESRPSEQRQQHPRTSDVSPEVTEPQIAAAPPPRPPGGPDGLHSGQESPPAAHPSAIPAETFPDQTGSSVFASTCGGRRADPTLTFEDPGQVDAHASTPSYLIHPIRPEQQVMEESSGNGERMREMVSELLGDDADLPLCGRDPEPWIRPGLEESRGAWAQGAPQAGFPQAGGRAEQMPALVSQLQPPMAQLGAYPYSTLMPRGPCVWGWHTGPYQPVSVRGLLPQGPVAPPGPSPYFGLDIRRLAGRGPQQPWAPFSNQLSAYQGARPALSALTCWSSYEAGVRPEVQLEKVGDDDPEADPGPPERPTPTHAQHAGPPVAGIRAVCPRSVVQKLQLLVCGLDAGPPLASG